MAKKATKKPVKAKKASAKQEKIATAYDLIAKKYGKEVIHQGSATRLGEYKVISTGSFKLDIATGIGGIPRGRIVEVFGPESAGKSTLTLHMISNVQRMGLKAAYIDAEHAFDPKYADALGVDLEELVFCQPDYGEQALDIAQILTESREYGVIILDSVAALTPKAEIDGDIGDSHMGLHARLMSQSMRKLCSVAARTDTCIVFVNQIRHKIGILFGSPETTTGGNALKFYASMRLDVRRRKPVKEGDVSVASETKVRVVKNKCAAPYGEAEFLIRYGYGIDAAAEVLDASVEAGLVEKSGAFFTIKSHTLPDGQIKVNGYSHACDLLRGNLGLLDDLWSKLLVKPRTFRVPDEEDEDEE